ncbi:50S ribosomal protein L1 [Mycoplasma sp. ATU-Cv-703]|uniref:50S ribosomal protein L1 n=1 Tax=Mycoplasma sp. ATU-Cv-703 TaxID=2498595 RepID=UPI000FDEE5EC
MARKSKKLILAWSKVDRKKHYPLAEAIKLAQETSYSKFDGSIDLAFNLNLDVRQADQQLRGSVALPNPTGKNVRVLVISDDTNVQELARLNGADEVANQNDAKAILSKEKFDFDIIVTDPKTMPFLAKYGKVLGPRGLMPNPKTGTVTPNVDRAVGEVKKGKANYRTDKTGIVHTSIGKVSLDSQHLIQNAETVVAAIKRVRPAAVKGAYIKNLTVSASMGPAIKVELV